MDEEDDTHRVLVNQLTEVLKENHSLKKRIEDLMHLRDEYIFVNDKLKNAEESVRVYEIKLSCVEQKTSNDLNLAHSRLLFEKQRNNTFKEEIRYLREKILKYKRIINELYLKIESEDEDSFTSTDDDAM